MMKAERWLTLMWDSKLNNRESRKAGLNMKRPVAVTICTACAGAGYNLRLTHRRCWEKYRRGTLQRHPLRATKTGDWRECASCQAIGVERNAQCSHCKGVGWQFVRN